MDLRNERGLIGEYHGREVHVVSKKDYDSGKCNDRNIIYVLADSNKYESLMVCKGVVIGHIDPHGGVTEYSTPFDYIVPKNKAKKEKVKAKEQKKEKAEAVGADAPTSLVKSFVPAEADEYLVWAKYNWDPISIAKAAVSLEVKPIAVG